MYRRVVFRNSKWVTNPVDVLYHVRGALPLTQYRSTTSTYDVNYAYYNEVCPVVFFDSIRLRFGAGIGPNHPHEFVLDVSENQPVVESVEEISTTGSAIVVYNENGVVVCSNGVSISTESSPTQTAVPGEMTSEPIDGTGEMTSEPIDGTGEMI